MIEVLAYSTNPQVTAVKSFPNRPRLLNTNFPVSELAAKIVWPITVWLAFEVSLPDWLSNIFIGWESGVKSSVAQGVREGERARERGRERCQKLWMVKREIRNFGFALSCVRMEKEMRTARERERDCVWEIEYERVRERCKKLWMIEGEWCVIEIWGFD